MPMKWDEQATLFVNGEPILEGTLRELVDTVGRIPSASWPSYSVTMANSDLEPNAYDGGFIRALVLRLRDVSGQK